MPNTIYDIVTSRIIDSLEKGVVPWKKNWKDAAISWSTGRGYKGINALLLTRPGEYITYTQIVENGGHVKKGAHQNIVVLYKPVTTGAKIDDDGEVIEGKTYMRPIRYYAVYHLDDVEGVEPRWNKEEAPHEVDPCDEADEVATNYIHRSGVNFASARQNEAFYRPGLDLVSMPEKDQFNSPADYYATFFHELGHSTGHSKRLARFSPADHATFGSNPYAKEELVAEITAAMVYSSCGLGSQSQLDNSAAYLNSWIKCLRGDSKLIVTASNAAQRAADLILGV